MLHRADLTWPVHKKRAYLMRSGPLQLDTQPRSINKVLQHSGNQLISTTHILYDIL